MRSEVIKSSQIKFAKLAHLAEVQFLKDRLTGNISEVPSGNPNNYHDHGRWKEYKSLKSCDKNCVKLKCAVMHSA